MAYVVETYPDGRKKMSDGTIQAAPNSFSSGAPVSNIDPVEQYGFKSQIGWDHPAAPKNFSEAPPTPAPAQLAQDVATGQTPPTQNPSQTPPQQTNQMPEIIKDVRNAIMSGMKIAELPKYYPELKGTDTTIFNQLAYDVEGGADPAKIPSAYPELFPEAQKPAEQPTSGTEDQINNALGGMWKFEQSYVKPIATLGEQLVKKPVDRFLDWVQGRELDPANTYDQSDFWKTAGATVNAGFNALLPWTSGAFNAAASTDIGGQILWSAPGQIGAGAALWGAAGGARGALVGAAIGAIPMGVEYVFDNVPWLKDYADSLTEEGKAGLIQTVSGLGMVGAGGMAGKVQGKSPQEIAQQLNALPKEMASKVVDAVQKASELGPKLKESVANLKTKANDYIEEKTTDIPKVEMAGNQSNPYISSVWQNLKERVKSEAGILDPKELRTEKFSELSTDLRAKLDKKATDLSEDWQIYSEFRNLPNPINLSPIMERFWKVFSDNGLKVVEWQVVREAGAKAWEIQAWDISKINTLFNDMKADAWKQWGNLTVDQGLTFRWTASKLAKYDASSTTKGRDVIRWLRSALDKNLKENVPWLKEIDKNYADKLHELENAYEGLVVKQGKNTGEFKDNFDSFIKNLGNERNSALSKRLEEVYPGITQQARAIEKIPYLYERMVKPSKAFEKIAHGWSILAGWYAGWLLWPVGSAVWILLWYAAGAKIADVLSKVQMRALDRGLSKISESGKKELLEIARKTENNEKVSNPDIERGKKLMREAMIKGKLGIGTDKPLALPAEGGSSGTKSLSTKKVNAPMDTQKVTKPEITPRSKIVQPTTDVSKLRDIQAEMRAMAEPNVQERVIKDTVQEAAKITEQAKEGGSGEQKIISVIEKKIKDGTISKEEALESLYRIVDDLIEGEKPAEKYLFMNENSIDRLFDFAKKVEEAKTEMEILAEKAKSEMASRPSQKPSTLKEKIVNSRKKK